MVLMLHWIHLFVLNVERRVFSLSALYHCLFPVGSIVTQNWSDSVSQLVCVLSQRHCYVCTEWLVVSF